MNPGQLNKRITFLEQTASQNSYGESENTWNEIATVWANVKPLQGRELYLAKQVHAEISSKITIRYRPGVLPKMRIKYGVRTLEIIAPPIDIEEKNLFLEIACKEVM